MERERERGGGEEGEKIVGNSELKKKKFIRRSASRSVEKNI